MLVLHRGSAEPSTKWLARSAQCAQNANRLLSLILACPAAACWFGWGRCTAQQPTKWLRLGMSVSAPLADGRWSPVARRRTLKNGPALTERDKAAAAASFGAGHWAGCTGIKKSDSVMSRFRRNDGQRPTPRGGRIERSGKRALAVKRRSGSSVLH